MTIASKKRLSYSVFKFPSLFHPGMIQLESRALERVLIELETTPGVIGWQRLDMAVPFSASGRTGEGVIQFAVARGDVPKQPDLWIQLVSGTGSVTELASLAAGRAACESRDAEHLSLAANRVPRGPFELQNRNAAHAWLLQAPRWKTRELEQELLQVIARKPLALSVVAKRTGLTELQTRLVFIRCWLRGLVEWDIGNESIAGDFLIEGANHG